MAEYPEMIGKYKISALVAKGGMGAVYKAVHPTLKRFVIIKKLTMKGNATVLERFKREAQILLDCNDPRIVHLFDYFKEGSSHYLVLEYVDGMSLDVLIKKRRYLSGEVSLLIFLEACKALKYAHDHGVVHRDIKPGNILISKTGDVKLADFGIATTEDVSDSDLTKEGMTLGTPSYMPPEQFENSKNVDKRADIYAMGVMLYEMVTGKRPFPGNFAPDTILLIQKGRYVSPRKLNPDLPPLAFTLIKKMMKAKAKRRYQDIGTVIQIIEKYFKRYKVELIHQSLVACMTIPNFEEPPYKKRTKKRGVFFAILLSLAAVGVGGYQAWTKGYVHTILLPDQYGEVKIAIRMPSSVKEEGDVFLKGTLFVNDRKDYPEADIPPLKFTKLNPSPAGDSYSFESNTLFVKRGQYRIKLLVEQRIYWYSFSVDSIQEMKKKNLPSKIISINFRDVPARPVTVRTEAVDALSGRIMTAVTQYLVLEKGNWIPLGDIPPGALITGTIRKFRAESPGYYSELFSLKIGPYQDELYLHADLVPLAGTLSIDGDVEHLVLHINDTQTLIAGGQDMNRISIADYKGGHKDLNLPSGKYEITAEVRKDVVRTTVSINPNEITRISIKEIGGSLQIKKE